MAPCHGVCCMGSAGPVLQWHSGRGVPSGSAGRCSSRMRPGILERHSEWHSWTGVRTGIPDWHSGRLSGLAFGAVVLGRLGWGQCSWHAAACSPSGPGQHPRLAIGPAMPPSGSAGPQPSGCQAGCMTSRALIHPVRWTRLQGGWLGSRSSGSLLEAADAEGRSRLVGRGCCGRAVQPAFSTSNRADWCLSGIRVATPPPDRLSRISAGRRVPQKGCGARTHHPQLCSPGPYQLRYRAVEWEGRDARTLRAFMGNASPFVEIPENATPSGAPIARQQPIGAPVGPAFSERQSARHPQRQPLDHWLRMSCGQPLVQNATPTTS